MIYKHENGYSAKLYGKSSMVVFRKGKKIFHTHYRNQNTKSEVMEMLEGMPSLMEIIAGEVKKDG